VILSYIQTTILRALYKSTCVFLTATVCACPRSHLTNRPSVGSGTYLITSFFTYLLPYSSLRIVPSSHNRWPNLTLVFVCVYFNNNNNNNNQDDIYGAVIMAKPLREFAWFIWWMQTQRRGGRQPSDQANRLGLWVRQKLQKEMATIIHIHHRHLIIIQPKSWYLFYHLTEDGRLSRPRHCSKGVQPVPMAVYRSGCRDIQLPMVRFEPGSSHTAVKHVTIRLLRHCIQCVIVYFVMAAFSLLLSDLVFQY